MVSVGDTRHSLILHESELVLGMQMNIKARWNITEEYYRLYFSDWLRGISNGRRWAIPIGFFITLVGMVFSIVEYFNSKSISMVGFALVGAGVAHIVWHFQEKRKWLKAMLSAGGVGEPVSLVFSSEGIEHSGPTSSGKISWKGIKSIVQEQNGLFLVLQKGISIYIPLQAITPPNSELTILRMFEDGNT